MPKKILIIDDEEDIVQLLKLRLQANGFDTVVAKDVNVAIQKAREKLPHLIIVDIKMPGGGGEFVFEQLKTTANTQAIPFIFISALPEKEIEKKIFAIGAEHYMTKPFDSKDLLKKIDRLIGV